MTASLSIVIPAKNEAASVGRVVGTARSLYPQAEIIVVDDGSDDATAATATAAGARVVRHPVSRGNGAAIKAGARAARGEILVFLDGDGQHDPGEIPALLAALDSGHDMAVGARRGDMHTSIARRLANWIYNTLATWITGVRVTDLTSGFRAVHAATFRRFMPLLPNGFSYPTTITMALLRAGHNVAFVPVRVVARQQGSSSHIRLLRDGGRFFLIIFRVGTLYSPLKIFFPVSMVFFLSGMGYCSYTMLALHQFTNGGALLLITSVLIFLIGLVSEQITALMFSQTRPFD